jgi:hypothetical protein
MKNKTPLVVAALMLVAILGVAYLTYITNPPQSTTSSSMTGSTPKSSWPFKGAYAQYSGSITYQANGTLHVTPQCGIGGSSLGHTTITESMIIRLEVLAYNSSKLDMLYYTNSTTTYGQSSGCPNITNATEWVNITAAPSQFPWVKVINLAYANASSTMITLHNQSYAVTDYCYRVTNFGVPPTRDDIFVSQSIGFPIRYAFQGISSIPTLNIDITQTNIPELSSMVAGTG